MYKAFETLLAEMEALRGDWSAYYAKDDDGNYCHPIHAGARTDCEAVWAAMYPKRSYSAEKAQKLMPDEIAAAMAPWIVKAQAYFKDWFAREEALKNRLADAAAPLDVPTSEEWLSWRSSSGADYGSQGFGKNKYARNSVEPYADRAKSCGIEAEVREELQFKGAGGCTCSGNTMKYTVWIKTTILGREILNYKPDLSIRDWVKSCWSRGVNPRVYCPYLPPGYEESEGLDFFGGERKAS